MRKVRKRQKYNGAEQYQLFDAHGNPLQDSNGGTEENAVVGGRTIFEIGATTNFNSKHFREDCRLWKHRQSIQSSSRE